jgi:predicted TIM-barrel fold metal-dependent hydrolase
MASKQKSLYSSQANSLHVSNLANETFEPLPYKPVSADSHVTEPPNCFVDNIESKYRDMAPRVVQGPRGGDIYVIEGLAMKPTVGGIACAGLTPANTGRTSLEATKFEDVPVGGYDGTARVAAQDRDGVGGEIVYPTVGMMICNHPDMDFKKACMDAYNRWLQQFQSAAPDRIFGVGQIAIRSVEEGISELRHIKEMGFRGVMMPGEPGTEFDYDDERFGEFWDAAIDLKLPLSFHILTSSSTMKAISSGTRGKSKTNYHAVLIRANQDIINMLIWGRVFDRHPQLKVVCVEADAGWAPHFMYRMDHFYNRKRVWSETEELPRLPSDYFLENVYLTFQDDFIAFRTADLMNDKRLLWASDFPHSDSTWPWSQQLIARQAAHLSDEQKRLILRDNVVELYNLPVN